MRFSLYACVTVEVDAVRPPTLCEAGVYPPPFASLSVFFAAIYSHPAAVHIDATLLQFYHTLTQSILVFFHLPSVISIKLSALRQLSGSLLPLPRVARFPLATTRVGIHQF
jgi:hypothetical protein